MLNLQANNLKTISFCGCQLEMVAYTPVIYTCWLTHTMENIRQLPLEHLLALPSNSICAQCGRSSRQWADLAHAIFLCLNCAASYKQFSWATNIKSIALDEWLPADLDRMERGGNESFLKFMKQFDLDTADIRERVTSTAARYYRGLLDGKEVGEQPAYAQGRATAKEDIPITEMSAEEMFVTAKEKAAWLGSKTKDLGERGLRKVQHKVESGELKQDVKDVAASVSTKAKWLWGVVREKVGGMAQDLKK